MGSNHMQPSGIDEQSARHAALLSGPYGSPLCVPAAEVATQPYLHS